MTDIAMGQPAPRASALSLIVAAIGTCGLFACMTALYLSMRGILDLGGFVAAGGPYEIAYPAPGWVWILPASCVAGAVFAIVQVIGAGMAGGFRILGAMWTVLFAALGWNFLQYGFNPPWGDGIAWGWVVSGVVFWLMAIPPVVGLLPWFKEFRDLATMSWSTKPRLVAGTGPWGVYLAANIAAAATGVIGGWAIFNAVAGG